MEELSEAFLDELEREPQTKRRKSKNLERDHRTWFYDISTNLGKCDNPDCKDKRGKPHVMVWMNPDGINMCRLCFLDGWLADGNN